jgi:ABC-type sugar transport system ATPase subunit
VRLELIGIHKSYGRTRVLHGVDLAADRGEVLALCGANGAGKTTLIKIVSGALALDAGEIVLDGEPAVIGSARDGHRLGIRTVYQELSLVPNLTVAENILLGALPARLGFVEWKDGHEEAAALLDRIGFTGIDTHTPVEQLSVARQQMVEIAKAIAVEPRILILDEPSAVLGGDDLERLFSLIRSLRDRGVLVIYVSHRLDELMQIADRIAVMKDGTIVDTRPPAETTPDEIVRLMAGRRIENIYPDRRGLEGAGVLLSVRQLSRPPAFEDVTFQVAAGEVVGMFGLVGSGRSDVALSLFGAQHPSSGDIELGGRRVTFKSPKAAIKNGIALLTEDRRRDGLVVSMPIRDNSSLATLHDVGRHGFVDRGRQRELVGGMVERLEIKPPNIDAVVAHLSGGNQQKVVLSKWLLAKPRLLILDEPTRGVDMATRVDLYQLIDGLARTGVGVLLISSDLTEVLGMTDRVLVMREGHVVADLRTAGTNEDEILGYSVGVAA